MWARRASGAALSLPLLRFWSFFSTSARSHLARDFSILRFIHLAITGSYNSCSLTELKYLMLSTSLRFFRINLSSMTSIVLPFCIWQLACHCGLAFGNPASRNSVFISLLLKTTKTLQNLATNRAGVKGQHPNAYEIHRQRRAKLPNPL